MRYIYVIIPKKHMPFTTILSFVDIFNDLTVKKTVLMLTGVCQREFMIDTIFGTPFF